MPFPSQLLHLLQHQTQARPCLLTAGGDFRFDPSHRTNEGGSSFPSSSVSDPPKGPRSFSLAPAAAATWLRLLSAEAAGQMEASCGLDAAREPSATAPYASGVLHTYQMSSLGYVADEV